MDFYGDNEECVEAIARIDAELGYPRTYTEADIGVLVFRRGGGIHAPIETVKTDTSARPLPVDVDSNGNPTSARRRVRFEGLRSGERVVVARARLRRLLNRGTRSRIASEIAGIGPARADAIIAHREANGRITRLTDLQGVIPASAIQALRDHLGNLQDDSDADLP